jgi:hypothetical protein
LRNSIRNKVILLITDGDLNMGAPLELAAAYAYNIGAKTCVVTIGGSKEAVAIRKQLDILVAAGIVKWIHAAYKGDLIKALKACPGG